MGPRTKPEKPATPKTPLAIPAQVEVAKGDTLFRIAGKVRHPGATLNQTVLALYRANPDAFFSGNINQLIVGQILKVPPPEAVTAVDAAQASLQLKALIARPVVPIPQPAPPVKEAPAPPKPKAEPAPKPAAGPAPALTQSQAAERFEEGVKLERNGDLKGAMTAYLAAGEAGNGIAQKRLGDIYNTGNAIIRRDYETALKWYQRARAQGVEIPKPITNPGVRY
jgi:FimV-like protein